MNEQTGTKLYPVYMNDKIPDEEFEAIEPIVPGMSADKMADLYMYLDRKADTQDAIGDPLTMYERRIFGGLTIRLHNDINIIGMKGDKS